MLLGTTNVEIVSILNCGLFGLSVFSFGWSRETDLRIKTLGLVGLVLEDIPQLVIQCYFLSLTSANPSAYVILSIVASCLAILHGTMKRVLISFVLCCRKRKDEAGPELDIIF